LARITRRRYGDRRVLLHGRWLERALTAGSLGRVRARDRDADARLDFTDVDQDRHGCRWCRRAVTGGQLDECVAHQLAARAVVESGIGRPLRQGLGQSSRLAEVGGSQPHPRVRLVYARLARYE
jgi:hypothetical protein